MPSVHICGSSNMNIVGTNITANQIDCTGRLCEAATCTCTLYIYMYVTVYIVQVLYVTVFCGHGLPLGKEINKLVTCIIWRFDYCNKITHAPVIYYPRVSIHIWLCEEINRLLFGGLQKNMPQ